MTTAASVPARVALAGNPSDGFGGAVVGLPFRACEASVEVAHARVAPSGLTDLADAARVVFGEHVPGSVPPPLHVRTTIPRSVGLAGSSAVVVASLRVMAGHHGIELAPAELAGLALRAEVEVLGVPAGLQDRAIQAFDEALHMDFRHVRSIDGLSHGSYRPILLTEAVPGFVAWRAASAESSAVVHRGLADRAQVGDLELVAAADELASLAGLGADALERSEWDDLGRAMDGSLEVRAGLVELRADHLELVSVVRALDAPVNYAGSGGSVVGLHHRCGYDQVAAALRDIGAVVQPVAYGPRANIVD